MNIFLIAAIAVYVLWALVPGYLAHKKGRAGWAFAVLGLVITPLISTIIIFCRKMSSEEIVEASAEVASEGDELPAEETEEERLLKLQEVAPVETPDEADELATDENTEEDASEETDEEEAPQEGASEEAEEASEETEEEEPLAEKKLCNLTLLAIIANAVMVIALGVLLFFGLKNIGRDGMIFDPDGAYGQNDVTALASYAIQEAATGDENMITVVAVDGNNEPVTTNADLQIAFWIEFYNFLQSYGNYAMYFGLDYNTSLAEQPSLDENMTWEQYFLESSLNKYNQDYALAQAAYDSGYVPSAEDQKNIDDVLDPAGSMVQKAIDSGFASVEDYIHSSFGPGVSLQDYQNYLKQYLAAYNQYTTVSTEIEATATDDSIAAYYDAHAEEMVSNHILNVSNVSVRHILISPEGEADATTGEYSEEAWTAAETKANDIYALWQEDPTEDNFAALATEHSADSGSTENGGLYENFDSDDMIEEFSNWSFDQSRKNGDTGIVKTTYGYHIMFFVEQTGTQGWIDTVREQYVNEEISAYVQKLCEEYPIKVDFTKVRIFDIITYSVNLATATEEPAATESVAE